MVVRKTHTPPQGSGDKRELISFISLSVTFPSKVACFKSSLKQFIVCIKKEVENMVSAEAVIWHISLGL